MTQELFCEKTKLDAWKKASASLQAEFEASKTDAEDKSPAWSEGYRNSLMHACEMAAWYEEFDSPSFVGENITLAYRDEGIAVIEKFKQKKKATSDNLAEARFPLMGEDAMDYLLGCQAAYDHALKLLRG
jgi:hypothetical protein